jgi:tetratricopeptide (TPR) repeat protein
LLKFSESLSLHRRALQIFEEFNDRWGLADSWDLIGIAQILGGDIRHAPPALDRAVALFEELNDLERLASTLGIYGMNYQIAFNGAFTIYKPRHVYRGYAERALATSRQIQARGSEAFALIALSIIVLGDGDFDRARQHLESAYGIAVEIGHTQWSLFAEFQFGIVACEMLDYERALPHLERAGELADTSRAPLWQEQARAGVGLCRWKLGDPDAAEALLQAVVAKQGDMVSIGEQQALFHLLGIALDRRDPQAALDVLSRMVVDEENPAAAVAMQRSAIFELQGQVEQTDAQLLLARRTAEDVGPRTLLWKIAAARARLWADRDSNIAASEAVLAQVERETLAATISDHDQRARFLAAAE